MNLQSEQIQTLNKIMAAIDEKATKYKDERFDMREAQSEAQKKLLLDLIDNAMQLAKEINPSPLDVMDDLNRLYAQIASMH